MRAALSTLVPGPGSIKLINVPAPDLGATRVTSSVPLGFTTGSRSFTSLVERPSPIICVIPEAPRLGTEVEVFPADLGPRVIVYAAKANDDEDETKEEVADDATEDLRGVDRGDGRDINGKFTGKGGYGKEAEAEALSQYEELTGNPVITQQVRATLPDFPYGRYYDGLVENPDGTYTGIEIKSNTATYGGQQAAFDNAVSADNPATAKLNGQTIKITEVIVRNVKY